MSTVVDFVSCINYRVSCANYHNLICLVSCVYRQSVMYDMFYQLSLVMCYVLRVMCNVSCVIYLTSCVMYLTSCVIYLMVCVIYLTSCVIYPASCVTCCVGGGGVMCRVSSI